MEVFSNTFFSSVNWNYENIQRVALAYAPKRSLSKKCAYKVHVGAWKKTTQLNHLHCFIHFLWFAHYSASVFEYMCSAIVHFVFSQIQFSSIAGTIISNDAQLRIHPVCIHTYVHKWKRNGRGGEERTESREDKEEKKCAYNRKSKMSENRKQRKNIDRSQKQIVRLDLRCCSNRQAAVFV